MRTKKDLPSLINKLLIETNDCILYPFLNKNGYGHIQYYSEEKKKLHYLAHRLSYELFYNVILKSEEIILHSCDTPACINPIHLSKGTHADNIKDKVSKNRQSKGITSGRAILNEEQVKQIKTSSDSNITLAKKYGVDRKAIYSIKKNITWKHL
jgi:hypothetical protein